LSTADTVTGPQRSCDDRSLLVEAQLRPRSSQYPAGPILVQVASRSATTIETETGAASSVPVAVGVSRELFGSGSSSDIWSLDPEACERSCYSSADRGHHPDASWQCPIPKFLLTFASAFAFAVRVSPAWTPPSMCAS
jgi:hypothetical protein